MKRFIKGEDRTQVTLLPACLDDYVEAENPVRVVEIFVDGLDLDALGFVGVDPAATGRPAYHPAVLLKLYIYGYLNRIQSSRRLEREAQRNVELMWLTGRLMPDFKTIANFRKDNGRAIRKVCRQFIVLCRQLNLFTEAIVAIDGSKFKAVNNRDKNFTPAKMQRRMAQIEESIARYLAAMDTADRAEPEVAELKKGRLQDKIAALKEQMQRLRMLERRVSLLSVLRSALDQPSVYLSIGHENEAPELRSASVVAASYGLGHRTLGTVSVIGPVRMDYRHAIASVRAAAHALSGFVEEVYE